MVKLCSPRHATLLVLVVALAGSLAISGCAEDTTNTPSVVDVMDNVPFMASGTFSFQVSSDIYDDLSDAANSQQSSSLLADVGCLLPHTPGSGPPATPSPTPTGASCG